MNYNSAPKSGGFVPRKTLIGPWEHWFAWYPVEVNDKHTWLTKVCRRKITYYLDLEEWSIYEYGTIFDVLTD